MTMYILKGDVRGNSKVKHRSLETAYRALLKDQKACQKVGGYSDRYICRVDGEPLDSSEIRTIDLLEQDGMYAR
jgi:hypothetical protein